MFKTLTFLFTLLILLSGMAYCQSSDLTEDNKFLDRVKNLSLSGVGGFQVNVDPMPTDVQYAGLPRNQIVSDVENKLRLNGIKILDGKEILDSPNQPTLNVLIKVPICDLGKSGRLYPYYIRLEVVQLMYLNKKDPIPKYPSATWTTEQLGITHDVSTIHNVINNNLDTFIKAWLSVNQKP